MPPDANIGLDLLDSRDALLCVIDVQHGFLARLPDARRTELTHRIRFIVEVAARLAVPTIVTVEDAPLNGPTDPAVLGVLPPDCREFDKRVFGLMGQPDLAGRVAATGRRTAVLVGLETDVCVLHSAVGLARAGWRSVIVSDACAAPGDAHAAGLERARALGVETIHTKGLYYEWARSLAGLARLKAHPAVIAPPGLEL